MATFNSIDRSKAYAAIVDQLLERIANGEFADGSKLPAERELSAQFGVSRGTLKEAIRVLEHAGVLEVRVGSGTYITGSASSTDLRLRAKAETEGDYSPLDVIIARRAIEPVSARTASVTATSSDRGRLRDALNEQRAATDAGADPTEADFEFHMRIAQASKNAVLEALTEQLINMMRRPSWTKMKSAARTAGDASHQFLVEHDRIMDAIEAGDGLSAGTAMADHLASIERGLRNQAGLLT